MAVLLPRTNPMTIGMPGIIALIQRTPSSVHRIGPPVSSGRDAYFRRVGAIGLQAAEALDYAHQNGTLHRDIKPANLIVDTHGIVWVLDFGLAKSGEDNLTMSGDVVGTIRYMAPERFDGKADVRSDIYSLGLTLYELATLQYAFDAKDRSSLIKQVTTQEARSLRSIDRRVPRDLENDHLEIARSESESSLSNFRRNG